MYRLDYVNVAEPNCSAGSTNTIQWVGENGDISKHYSRKYVADGK